MNFRESDEFYATLKLKKETLNGHYQAALKTSVTILPGQAVYASLCEIFYVNNSKLFFNMHDGAFQIACPTFTGKCSGAGDGQGGCAGGGGGGGGSGGSSGGYMADDEMSDDSTSVGNPTSTKNAPIFLDCCLEKV